MLANARSSDEKNSEIFPLAEDRSRTAAIHPPAFRRCLMSWYRAHARELPWRGISDPYRTWVSEVMLQQTRVEAVIDHYNNFLHRFPTVLALALATEEDV